MAEPTKEHLANNERYAELRHLTFTHGWREQFVQACSEWEHANPDAEDYDLDVVEQRICELIETDAGANRPR